MLITITATPYHNQIVQQHKARHYTSNGVDVNTVIGDLVNAVMNDVCIELPDNYTIVLSFSTQF